MNVPETFTPNVLDGDKLKPDLAKEGILLYRVADPDLTYTAFNMRDPVIGGFAKEKIALRRAMAMAYNVEEQIKVVRKGQAMHMQMPIPPGVVGHDPHYRSIIQYDPDTANKLLDYFGYKKGPDGWRTLPDGKPLVIQLASQPSSSSRELDELWHKSLSSIGIRMEVQDRAARRQHPGRQGLQAADVGPGVDRRLSRRRQLHAAPLWAEHRAEQQRLLRVEGVRRVLRKVHAAARLGRSATGCSSK